MQNYFLPDKFGVPLVNEAHTQMSGKSHLDELLSLLTDLEHNPSPLDLRHSIKSLISSELNRSSSTLEWPARMDRNQAATYLGCTRKTLEFWHSTGKQRIPCFRLGRKIVYDKRDLDEWLEKKRVL